LHRLGILDLQLLAYDSSMHKLKPQAAIAQLTSNLADLQGRIEAAQRRLEDLAASAARQEAGLATVMEILQIVHDEEPANRRRLYELRESPEYELAFSEPEPLVSVTIPTYNKADMLKERSIPSALEQSYGKIEVVVVGDASPPEVGEAVASFEDPRVRFYNLPIRGPYPSDPHRAWLASGTSPYNLLMAKARGRWVAPVSDDDTLTPDHVEVLLAAARDRQLEFVYGLLRQNHPDGTHELLGEFPPSYGRFGFQAALLHSGLRFMHMHLTDALFDLPNDWALCRRMIRVGVRIGMIDAVVGDYYPSSLWGRNDERSSMHATDTGSPQAQATPSDIAELEAAQGRVTQLQAQLDRLEHDLAVVLSSKSWRLTRLLREASAWRRGASRQGQSLP
jgi:hypothetical protein